MMWSLLPEPVLISILSYFQYHEVITIGYTCKRWNIVSKDNLLWKTFLCRDFKISMKTKIHPSGSFWLEEYSRLIDDTPNVMSEEVPHDDEVWHVSFSNSGKFFVTCCKNANIRVFNMNNDGTTSLRYREDMRKYGWQGTYSSQFNSNDSLLLVAGYNNIVIFKCTDIGDYEMLCKIKNGKKCIMCGATVWTDENMWLSGGGCGCRQDPVNPALIDYKVYIHRALPDYRHGLNIQEESINIAFKSSKHLSKFILSNRKHFTEDSVFPTYKDVGTTFQEFSIQEKHTNEKYESRIQENKFCLIFRCGETRTSPHQIGFKRLYPEDLSSVPFISGPDKMIEMNGKIVAITKDREERFLYVNVRPWRKAAVLADDMVTRVIDLQDLSLTSQVYRGHQGYSTAHAGLLIYPDVGRTFVGSGSEDGFAFIWDKHYGCQLATNKHDDNVNCVAFSPTDSGVMVSAGDDNRAKVWISRSKGRSLHKPLAD